MNNIEIKQFLNKYKRLNEQAVVFTPELLRNVINQITLDDIELEEDEKVVEQTIKTLYNEYKIYGLEYDDIFVMPLGDYKNYVKDVADEFVTVFPDGFEQFLDINTLSTQMEKDNYYVVQAIKFINKVDDKDYYCYEKTDMGSVDGIDYVLLKEII